MPGVTNEDNSQQTLWKKRVTAILLCHTNLTDFKREEDEIFGFSSRKV